MACWQASGKGATAVACGEVKFNPETKELVATGGFTSATGHTRASQTVSVKLTEDPEVNNYILGAVALKTVHFWDAFVALCKGTGVEEILAHPLEFQNWAKRVNWDRGKNPKALKGWRVACGVPYEKA